MSRLYWIWCYVWGYLWLIVAFFRGGQWEPVLYRPSGRERDRQLLDEPKETHS